MPHQGIVTVSVALLSLAITLGILVYILGFGREKRNLAANSVDKDEH